MPVELRQQAPFFQGLALRRQAQYLLYATNKTRENAYSQKETSLAKPLGQEVAEWRVKPALANEPCAGA